MNIVQYRLKKGIVVLSCLLFLCIFATALVSYMWIGKRLNTELNQTNMQLLRQVDHKITLALQHIDKTSMQVLGYDELRKFFDDEQTEQELIENGYKIDRMIRQLIHSDDYIFSISFYSYRHRRYLSSHPLLEEHPLNDFAWTAQFEHYDGFVQWLPTRRLLIRGADYPIYRNVVTLVRTYPLIHSKGFRRGAVAVNIKEEALYALLGNEPGPQLVYNFIIDGNGQVVVHHDKSKFGQNISNLPYISAILRSGRQEGYEYADVDGTPSIVFFVTSSYNRWILLRVVPEIRQQQETAVTRHILLIIAGFLLLAAAAGVSVGLWTFKPINRFMSTLSKKLGSHHPRHTGQRYKDEFQYLETTLQDILNNSERLHRQMAEIRPLIKWRLMADLFTNDRLDVDQVMRQLQMHDIKIYAHRFIVMVVEFDNRHEMEDLRDLKLYTYALCNVAEELINAECRGVAVELENGRCAILVSFDEGNDEEKCLIHAVTMADLIRNFATEYFKRTVTIGIGNVVDSMREVHQSFRKSMEALKYKLIMGNNLVITSDDVESEHTAEFHKLLAMVDQIMESVKMCDAEKLRLEVRRWFESFSQCNAPPDIINQLCVQCLMNAATIAFEIGVKPEELVLSQNLPEILNQYERLDQIEQFMAGTLEDFLEKIKARHNAREINATVENVLKVIKEQYMRSDLSLNYLADKFRVSVSHLSKVFKEYTGQNFLDYLMEIRILHAKRLLAGTELKIREVAEEVGYTNVNSFVRVFKKMTGLTPGEFRNRERFREHQHL